MDQADEHDGAGNGDREEQQRHRLGSTSDGGTPQSPKLVPVKGTGLSGPFIQRPVMTVLLTLSVIVAGIATYNKLAVNDLPAVDYPIIQVSCSYPGADPVTMANNIATPLEKQFLQIPGLHHHQLKHAEQHLANASICAEQEHHRRGDGRAGRDSTRDREVAARSAESANIQQDEPERSGRLFARPDVGHHDGRRSI